MNHPVHEIIKNCRNDIYQIWKKSENVYMIKHYQYSPRCNKYVYVSHSGYKSKQQIEKQFEIVI